MKDKYKIQALIQYMTQEKILAISVIGFSLTHMFGLFGGLLLISTTAFYASQDH